MSTKHLFVKHRHPLRRRLLIWGGPVLLLGLIWSDLRSPRIDSGAGAWTAPVEPPGVVVVTSNTVSVPAQPSTTTSTQDQSQNSTSVADNKTSMKAVQAPAEPTQPVDEHAALNETLNQWRQAWSAKNVTSYLSFYGPDFVPPKGLNRTTWEAARNERISSKEKIVIDIQNLRLQINNNTATAKFTQAYRDERLRMTDSKTLVWQKLNGRWLILRETTE